jgi:predicted  nucleic acid-binding Zn-ribbon protein
MARHPVAEGENKDLNLHVELCSERYHRLEEKFTTVEQRLEHLHHDFDAFKKQSDANFKEVKALIGESKEKRFNTMVTATGSIIVALSAMMGYLVTHLPK